MNLPSSEDDPLGAFVVWKQALSPADDAAVLATSDDRGRPDARVVLVKQPFEFHTNTLSAKGRQLEANPFAALVFQWRPDHQVRVLGRVERLDETESDAYWSTRPRGSQLGAWASRQSEPVTEAELRAALDETTERFEGAEVGRPAHWGGYRVVPDAIEFWRHRDDRLHERLRFRLVDGRWLAERLAP